MTNHYDTWLSEPSCHEYTKGGNMTAPSRRLLCDWVKDCWDAISTETIKNSFLSCAITASTDGSDDDLIHCFKEVQPCAEEGDDDNLSDPFACDSDEDEMEENEVIVDNDSVTQDLELDTEDEFEDN